MNSATTTINLIAMSVPNILKAFENAPAGAFRLMWNAIMPQISGHWLELLTILFGVFMFLLLYAFITGWWGSLGSFLYHFFYLGTLLLIGWIFGPETYASDYLKVFLLILWPTCYFITGIILGNFGFSKY